MELIKSIFQKIEAGQLRVKLDTMYAITTALHISIDTLIADYDNSNDEANLKLILDEIRGYESQTA